MKDIALRHPAPLVTDDEQLGPEFTALRLGAVLAPAVAKYPKAAKPTRKELLGRRRVVELEIQNLTKELDALEQQLYPTAS